MTCLCGSSFSRSEDGEYLLLEGNGKKGYCSLHYCEIEWMDSFKDEVREDRSFDLQSYSQLKRIIPFSLPSLECCDDLRINHITMQTLRMNDRFARHPSVSLHRKSQSQDADTVVLRIHLYIWNSLRGYMYQFFNTNKNPLYHVIGKQDVRLDSRLHTELDHHRNHRP